MTRLPVLPPEPDSIDHLTIATPCDVPWASLVGDDRVRYCGRCSQSVYNIAAMDRREARRLLESRTGRLCLRLYRRVDGTIVTADCWSRLRAARRRGRLALGAALVAVVCAEISGMWFGLQGLYRFWNRARSAMPVSLEVTPPPIGELPAPPPLPNNQPHELLLLGGI
jgi:hypothetical protein